jgi:excisionase family DNA binding protein
MNDHGLDMLLTPGQVAEIFAVCPKTVVRWAAAGQIGSVRTPGGHVRFHESDVRALLGRQTNGAAEAGPDGGATLRPDPGESP